METKESKIVKTIRIDAEKYTGCRVCEAVCSAFHAEPKHRSIQRGLESVSFRMKRMMFMSLS